MASSWRVAGVVGAVILSAVAAYAGWSTTNAVPGSANAAASSVVKRNLR